ncbi:GGDEF domain-containing protein [Aquincola sp. S2]|uniref:diguanylate cyclase n=1 Tax=Pseudaquabacterium terrae TaxID=2732868 RepID=A0ABX2EHE2_9BURK|nr:GGDEF domain-containing protein [Aquabacterium terrae]NRF68033.1 GGDEF domain-containing protein [Aquabacterium terrae]
MTLHIPTLMLALLLGFLLLTLELGVALRRLHNRPELRSWTWGCWALFAGFAMLAARVVVPVWLSIVLGNGLICLGILMYTRALYRMLLDAPLPRWLIAAFGTSVLGIVVMLSWPMHQRTAIVSMFFVVLLVPAVAIVVRHGWSAERSLRTVAVTMGLAAVALGVRAVHAWLNPGDYTDLLQASLGQGLTFLMSFLSIMGAGFAFVLAVFERVALQMEKLATHDGLTGCLNRSTIDAMLSHALERGRRDRSPVSFVLLDLDHFKLVNDQHGHRTGDAVLRAFARTVRERLRASDVFGRTGGEEFGVVLPGTDASGARRLLEQVRGAVEAMQVRDTIGHPVRITVSAGLAVADPASPISGDRLYGRADRALYEAKHGGRNRVETYSGAESGFFAQEKAPAGAKVPQ